MKKRLTKLQNEFINQNLGDGFVVFPLSIFKSKEYKNWKRNKRLKNETIKIKIKSKQPTEV